MNDRLTYRPSAQPIYMFIYLRIINSRTYVCIYILFIYLFIDRQLLSKLGIGFSRQEVKQWAYFAQCNNSYESAFYTADSYLLCTFDFPLKCISKTRR
jgi:hypothetical protein